ncbi:MAG: hypothetical protein L3J51_09135 [Cocleimonas sp.]|nr:hypothetical protein [Cocleimonas sp.]
MIILQKARFGTLLVLTSLMINACGGGSSDKTVQISPDTDHPTFERSKVTHSPSYSPSGKITEQTPSFSWSAIANASKYRIGHENTNDDSLWKSYIFTASEAGCDSNSDTCQYDQINDNFPVGEEKVWWIKAMVNNKWQAWSKPIIFTVVNDNSGGDIDAPVQIAPSGTIGSINPTFSWNRVAGAVSYNIGYEEVSPTSSWSETIFSAADANCDSGGTCSGQVSPSTNGSDVSWWVKAQNSDGEWSDWSAGLDFVVDSTAQQIPDEAYQVLCLGAAAPTPASENFIDGVIYNAKRYYVDPNNNKRLMVSDENGDNAQEIASSSLLPPSFVSNTRGALIYSSTVRAGTKTATTYHRIQDDNTPIGVGTKTYKSSSSKLSYSNGLDIGLHKINGSRNSYTIKSLMVKNPATSTETTLISDDTRKNPRHSFDIHYLNGTVYYYHQEGNAKKVTGFINASGELSPVSTCN